MKSARFALILGLLALPAWTADKQPPPATPFTVFVYATPELPGPPDLAVKSQKELVDSANDVRKHITDKRKKWMRLVQKPEEAEVVLELRARQYDPGHGYVLEGQVLALDVIDAKVIGQGGLNPQQIFNIWRDAAHDLAGRLEQYVLRDKQAVLERARGTAPKPWAGRELREGDRKLDAGAFADAIAAYGRALAISPRSIVALHNRGLAHARAGLHREAVADLTAVIELDASNASAHLLRAKERAALGDAEGASQDFAEAIRLDPKSGAARLARGTLHLDAGRYAAAIQDLDAAEQLGVKDAALQYNRGLAYLGEARTKPPAEAQPLLQTALLALNEAVAADPKDKAALSLRAEVKARRGECGTAVEDFSRAIEAGAAGATILLGRGVCQARLGKTDLAIADYSAAIEADPKAALAYWNRSQAYKKKGLTTRSVSDRKKALDLDPEVARRELTF